MLRLKVLGAAEEIGRAAFIIEYKQKKILLDYGVELTKPPKFPLHVKPREISALFLSHAHLDHIGAAPYIYTSIGVPLYTTKPTIELSDLLIRDFLKLSGEYLPYEYLDFIFMRKMLHKISYRNNYEIPDTEFDIEIFDAGHIPGSAQIIINAGKYRILYTGDVNTYDTRLQRPADLKYIKDINILIIESTYANEIHPERKRLEKKFIEAIEEIVDNGGIALIPAFALGRSQEVLLILYHRRFKGLVSMDGMAVTATNILLENKEFIRDYSSLKKAFKKVNKIQKWKERKKIVKEPGVIIAPAGMLGGGTAVFYMNRVYENEKNGIFLVGYQAPGTPGRALLEEKVIMRGSSIKKVKSQVYSFRFSSHTDQKGLKKILSKLNSDVKVYIVHGESEGRVILKTICENEYSMNAYLPKLGDEFEIY